MFNNNCTQDVDTAFAHDVEKGLSRQPKMLSSMYFYDRRGDELFQAIMRMPEYYLTDSELEIFTGQKDQILNAVGDEPFELIELGAGDGYKTKVLLSHFLEKEVSFVYRPVDISPNVLHHLQQDLKKQWPELLVRPLNGDYFRMLERLQSEAGHRKVILFLGANIGNYTYDEAADFLSQLCAQMGPDDLLLIGFDLKKDPAVILDAYNDRAGITAAFNLNLLERINRELGADFVIDEFHHWETYDPVNGAARSYIVSKKEQTVQVEALGRSFHFEAWEAIDVELSLKYSPNELEELAHRAGFEPLRHFYDDRRYFVDSLWRVR
ncbi:MAG: L-histidine N(alpha)-methyltransferase [Saprospiraceae bacterium]|nr:L-histidine N(alpha)-methyltransferase [Lewinella sp.]